jgi:hypothetical protein
MKMDHREVGCENGQNPTMAGFGTISTETSGSAISVKTRYKRQNFYGYIYWKLTRQDIIS